jgi:hypothetical protein
MLRMDQVHVIRHKVLVEGRSERAVARELGISRSWIGATRIPGMLPARRRCRRSCGQNGRCRGRHC